MLPNTIIKLRNILYGTGVELTISYFLNRLYRNIFLSDYKRKKYIYRSSKLYYLSNKENQKSKIKS
jgi:ribosomal protein L19